MPAQQDLLDRLAAFPATSLPVLSLYLNTKPNQHGKDEIDRFLRRELPARGRTFEPHTPERESYDRDVERIMRWVSEELRPSSNGVAIFACAGADDLFEAVQLEVPVSEHRLYVYHQPQLYELARLTDAYRRYAAVVADSREARIFVFALGTTLDRREIESPTENRTRVGGWSQARYQRHVDRQRQQHAKELVEELERIVRTDRIDNIVLAGDEVIIPLIRAELPPALQEKMIDVVRLDITTPEHEVLASTLEAMQAEDSREDADRVRRAIDGYRSGGLGVAGLAPTLVALIRGQVGELLLAADFEARHPEPVGRDSDLVPPELAAELAAEGETVDLGAELVTRARNTGAPVSFIEDASLLEQVDGVAALLRFTL